MTHEALSLATIGAIVLHALALLGDSFFHPTIADLLVPFHLNYKEPYMALGIISGWLMLIFGLSYYVRDRIGINRWKVLHRLTAVAWILGVDPYPRRGHRRRHHLVSDPDRDDGDPGCGAADRADADDAERRQIGTPTPGPPARLDQDPAGAPRERRSFL